MFKFSNISYRIMCEICSKLTMEASDVILISLLCFVVAVVVVVVVCLLLFFCWFWTSFSSRIHVKTVNKSFQPLSIFCHNEHYLRCYIGLEWNIVTWSTKLWGMGGKFHGLEKMWKRHPPRCPKNIFPEVFRTKLFAFSIKWTKWNQYQFIDVDYGFAINFCILCLVKTHNHFWKLTYKVKYIDQINGGLINYHFFQKFEGIRIFLSNIVRIQEKWLQT